MKSILILDDEQVVRESFADYFEDNLWFPIQAASAEEALEILKYKQPPAAIVDLRLPRMNGKEFIREVHHRGINMACIICTGSPEFTIPHDILSMPMVSNRLFKKPVDHLEELKKEIEYILGAISKEGHG